MMTMNDLSINDTPTPSKPLTKSERAKILYESRAKATWIGYMCDWQSFAKWCNGVGETPMPASPEAICRYFDYMASNKALATIERHLASLTVLHKTRGIDPPPTQSLLVKEKMRSLRRTMKRRQKKAKPITRDILEEIKWPSEHHGILCRALILLGWAGALRVSEIVAVNIQDVEFVKGGLKLFIPQSKTDQAGEGTTLHVPMLAPQIDPVAAVRHYIKVIGEDRGPLFRAAVSEHLVRLNNQEEGRLFLRTRISERTVKRIVPKMVATTGRDPKGYSSHSLRSGLITQLARDKALPHEIMEHSRHGSITVVMGYIRDEQGIENSPLLKLK